MMIPAWGLAFCCVVLFFFGASVYSFLNVVIFRVPRGEEFVKTRSHCPGCGKILSPAELVPVVSYVCLGGKCKKCGSRIGIRDVLIEVFGGLSAIASFLLNFREPAGSMLQILTGDFYARFFAGLTAFFFIGFLTVICFINIDTDQVKSGTLVALLAVGVIGIFTLPSLDAVSRLTGAACGGIALLILGALLQKKDFYGAAAVAAIGGCMLGQQGLIIAVLVALLALIIESLYLLVRGKKPFLRHFKIVPPICIGLLTAVLFGIQLADLFL
ncbi:MAG: prepilin peptidase [Lachnospiraceae bacterium]|nr:prepilin peptidase [Lachnospiraceae bacterium]